MSSDSFIRKIQKDGKRLLVGLFVVAGFVGALASSGVVYAINQPPAGNGPTGQAPTGSGTNCATSNAPGDCTSLDCASYSASGSCQPPKPAPYYCGNNAGKVYMSIDIGCNHQADNAITDGIFAILRFLSLGVGLVLTASTVYAGVQYVLARDDPNAVGAAKKRIQSNVEALLLFIFAAAILNYLVPNFLH